MGAATSKHELLAALDRDLARLTKTLAHVDETAAGLRAPGDEGCWHAV